ncbi:MAG: U32 family peptidase, partial [Asticcacaulis sp.]
AFAASEDEIEINDLSLMANRGGRPFTAGPLLNVYNSESLSVLVERGCRRLCANIELSLDALGNISRQHPGLDLEIFAFGRLPLALSGRCYHARAEGLHKDACRYVCDLDPNGRHVSTLDGTEFLAVNGIQTLSWGVQTLTHSVQALKQAGVSALRLSPQAGDMAKVIAAYHAFTDEHESLSDLHKRLAQAALPGPLIGGYWLGQPGAKAVG